MLGGSHFFKKNRNKQGKETTGADVSTVIKTTTELRSTKATESHE
jgi:hypothetical protein